MDDLMLQDLAMQVGTTSSDPLLMNLANFFVYKESAKVIGRAYLRSVPEEAEVSKWVAGICSLQVERHAVLATAAPEQCRARHREQSTQRRGEIG